MSIVDEATPFGAQVAKRLADETIIWLTAIADDTPQPNPVWFLWAHDEFLVFSEPSAKRLGHIVASPRVSLNFNSTASGGDVAVFTGQGRVGVPPASADIAAYAKKYAKGFKDIKMTEESFFATYSTSIYIRPDHLRGF
ncbi:TIGR03667 family PPOX class F420-dependent oxidoreductase [Nocardia camponoti]|uniref:Pyridoxamine 5'-phosphate oxidase N-terminal domain-containing protein n=1 Tax=Nocardia camponoti TaxID=1616106 RepID=A0A917QME0_9NOCA|nr:TIGR03667 family PPOX class F420-dependent oxidoreductase [Nocardia camponoti]GGK57867.1 hypothetical protein GCM10011591_32570 [Nocardia camponoti]